MCWPAGEQVMVSPPSARRAAVKKRAATCDPHVSDTFLSLYETCFCHIKHKYIIKLQGISANL